MALNFNQKQYEKAEQINLLVYLKSKGHEFKKEGSRYRHKEHDSLIISEDNKWFWNSRGLYGSNAISYLQLVEGKTLPEAVNILAGENIIPNKHKTEYEPDKKIAEKERSFILPEKSRNYRRAFAYLNKTRGIDGEIISEMMKQKKIYESAEYHNCVFIGYDEQNEPKHAAMWGTFTPKNNKPFKGEVPASDKTCGFHMKGTSDTVYVFESPIDAMSHATLLKIDDIDWRVDHRLSLCCTWDGALERFLKTHMIRRIVFCLDNDYGGHTASEKYMKKYSEVGYDVIGFEPKANDFNDELLNILEIKDNKLFDMVIEL